MTEGARANRTGLSSASAFGGVIRFGGMLLLLASVTSVTSVACTVPPTDPRVTEDVPDRASFAPVSDLLEHRCGSLDCHGIPQRNLRLYGSEGLRFSPSARPSSQPSTTEAEYDQNFLSIVGLEPEIMSTVVEERGANPLRLTLLRKPLGIENHKGGTLFSMGDSQMGCVTSWLGGKTDSAQCVAATLDNP